MDSNRIFTVLLCTAWIFYMEINIHTASLLTIEPSKYTALTSDRVHLSCTPDGIDASTKYEVVLLQIAKRGDKPIGQIHKDNKVSYAYTATKTYQLEGHIDKEPMDSYLNITLMDPESDRSGTYDCVVFYLDDDDVLQQDKDTAFLAVYDTADVKTLESIVVKLMDRVKQLESKTKLLARKDSVIKVDAKVDVLNHIKVKRLNDSVTGILDRLDEMVNRTDTNSRKITSLQATKQDSLVDLTDRVSYLEEKINNQTSHINRLCGQGDSITKLQNKLTVLENHIQQQAKEIKMFGNKASAKSVVFSAALKSSLTPVVEKALVFDDVIINKGQGYNPKLGEFTAPVDGVYAFHLVAKSECTDCYLDINLMTDNEVLARLSVDSFNSFDQSSFSSVTELKKGTRVRAIEKSGTADLVLRGGRQTMLSGYLILSL